ncbi:MAG: hypothetical protein AABZ57_03835, partial [Candidatus Margulisiibacteriota bacterium]
MQFDLWMHKAIQAMVGKRTITDPGPSSVALTHTQHYEGQNCSNYSATEPQLAGPRAKEGGLPVAVESAFEATRIDHPGIMYETKAKLLLAIAEQSIGDMERGAALVHANTEESSGRGNVSINDVYDAVKTRFAGTNIPVYSVEDLEDLSDRISKEEDCSELIKTLKQKAERSGGKKEIGFVAQSEEAAPFIVLRLTDEKGIRNQERLAKLIGTARTMTITDIANRALNPGLKRAVDLAQGTHVVIRAHMTGWKTSVRHFLQEIGRGGRPDPSTGERAYAETRISCSLEDPNLSPDVRTHLEWEIKENSGKPVIFLPPDYPDYPEDMPAEQLERLKTTVREQIHTLELTGAIDKDAADKARDVVDKATSSPSEIIAHMRSLNSDVTAIINDFWRVSEEKAMEENMYFESSRSKFDDLVIDKLTQLDQLLGCSESDPELISGIFGDALKNTAGRIMNECKISDAGPRSEWDIVRFEKLMRRLGIDVDINTRSFRTAEEMKDRMFEIIDAELSKASLGPGQTRVSLIRVIKERFNELKRTVEMARRENYGLPDQRTRDEALDRWASAEAEMIISEGDRPSGFHRRVLDMGGMPQSSKGFSISFLRVTSGKALGLGKQQVVVSGKQEPAVHVAWGKMSAEYRADVEKQLEYKFRTIVEKNGIVDGESNAATIDIVVLEEGKEVTKTYSLASLEDRTLKDETTGVQETILGIKSLNRSLKNNGSSMRVYFNEREREYIYGSADVKEIGKEERQVVIDERVISPTIRDWAAAFIPRTPADVFDDGVKHETVIRKKAQQENYDKMIDLAFSEQSHMLPSSRFAKKLFESQGITSREAANNEEAKGKVLSLMLSVVADHETGHAEEFNNTELDKVNKSKYLSELEDALYETVADLHILKKTAESEKSDAEARVYAHLYHLSLDWQGARGRMAGRMIALLETHKNSDGTISLKKLVQTAETLSAQLTKRLSDINGELQTISDEQTKLDYLFEQEKKVLDELGGMPTTTRSDKKPETPVATLEDKGREATRHAAEELDEELKDAARKGRNLDANAVASIIRNNSGCDPKVIIEDAVSKGALSKEEAAGLKKDFRVDEEPAASRLPGAGAGRTSSPKQPVTLPPAVKPANRVRVTSRYEVTPEGRVCKLTISEKGMTVESLELENGQFDAFDGNRYRVEKGKIKGTDVENKEKEFRFYEIDGIDYRKTAGSWEKWDGKSWQKATDAEAGSARTKVTLNEIETEVRHGTQSTLLFAFAGTLVDWMFKKAKGEDITAGQICIDFKNNSIQMLGFNTKVVAAQRIARLGKGISGKVVFFYDSLTSMKDPASTFVGAENIIGFESFGSAAHAIFSLRKLAAMNPLLKMVLETTFQLTGAKIFEEAATMLLEEHPGILDVPIVTGSLRALQTVASLTDYTPGALISDRLFKTDSFFHQTAEWGVNLVALRGGKFAATKAGELLADSKYAQQFNRLSYRLGRMSEGAGVFGRGLSAASLGFMVGALVNDNPLVYFGGDAAACGLGWLICGGLASTLGIAAGGLGFAGGVLYQIGDMQLQELERVDEYLRIRGGKNEFLSFEYAQPQLGFISPTVGRGYTREQLVEMFPPFLDKDVLKARDRFHKAKQYFVEGKLLNEQLISAVRRGRIDPSIFNRYGKDNSDKIWRSLISSGYIDGNGAILPKFNIDIQTNKFNIDVAFMFIANCHSTPKDREAKSKEALKEICAIIAHTQEPFKALSDLEIKILFENRKNLGIAIDKYCQFYDQRISNYKLISRLGYTWILGQSAPDIKSEAKILGIPFAEIDGDAVGPTSLDLIGAYFNSKCRKDPAFAKDDDKVREFLNSHIPNWRFILFTSKGRSKFENMKALHNIWKTNAVQEYAARLDAGKIVPINLVEVYLTHPGLADRVLPGKFWTTEDKEVKAILEKYYGKVKKTEETYKNNLDFVERYCGKTDVAQWASGKMTKAEAKQIIDRANANRTKLIKENIATYSTRSARLKTEIYGPKGIKEEFSKVWPSTLGKEIYITRETVNKGQANEQRIIKIKFG